MKNRCKILFLTLFIILNILFPITLFAHSGRTDSSGGHRDNQNRSGLGYYHYHCGGHPAHLHKNGVCPYSNQSEKVYSPTKDKLTIVKYDSNMVAGESQNIEYDLVSANYSSVSVKSSNPSVVDVYGETLFAKSAGVATITISTDTTSKSITVTVKEIYAKKIKLSIPSKELQVGEFLTLTSKIYPQNTTNKEVKYYSSDESIATITEYGKIKGISPGNVTITAEAVNGISKSINIEVCEVPNKIECQDLIHLIVGDTYDPIIKILPENANNKDFTITCNDINILKYENHQFKAIKEGYATLHIETWNGITKDVSVTIDAIPVESINIIDSTTYIASNIIDVNDKIMLDTKIYPGNATYRNVEWESSNNDIIEVDNNNFKIVGTGKVTLTCYSHENVSNSVTFFIINLTIIKTMFFLLISFMTIIMFVIIKRRRLLNSDRIQEKNFNITNSNSTNSNYEIDSGLQENYKLQINPNGEELQENKDIALNVKNDFLKIKSKILKEAELCHFKIIDDKKSISIAYSSSFLLGCIDSEKMKNSMQVTYYIENERKYKLYLYAMKKYASKYKISISPFLVITDEFNKKRLINLPFTIDDNTASHKIKAYLKCTIKY